MAALWSVLALSGTIASEVRRGSIEFVATTPLGKRRIALEKLAAHVTGMAIVVLVTTVCTYVAGTFGTLPGDAISWTSAFGFGLWVGVVALASGSVAFALAPFVGRGASAAIAGAVLLFGYFANGYQDAAPAFAPFANLTWWGWTVHHQPLVNSFDWASLVPAIVLTIALFTVGVVAFARRDLGAVAADPVAADARVRAGPRRAVLALARGAAAARLLVGDRHRPDGLRVRRGRAVVQRDAPGPVARHAQRSSRPRSRRSTCCRAPGRSSSSRSSRSGSSSPGSPRRPSSRAGPRTRPTAGSRSSCPRRCRAPAGRSAAASACTRRSAS